MLFSSSFLVLLHLDVEGGTLDVFLSPFDENDVVSFLPDHIVDGVLLGSLVLDQHFITRRFRPINPDKENIISCSGAVNTETVMAIQNGRAES